jgi:hypothetical protein
MEKLSKTGTKSDGGEGRTAIPNPVPLKVYDETIRVMKSAVQKAKLGRDDEMQALKRVDGEARRLEGFADGPSLEAFVDGQRTASPALDDRSVFGWERDLAGSQLVRHGGKAC